jgi:hypothetical protein
MGAPVSLFCVASVADQFWVFDLLVRENLVHGKQDRVIRIEERIRFERILPADLHPRIGEFTIDQLVALRFASNAELPELARKVLDEKLNDRKAIKQMIKTWRPDFARA